MEEEWRDIVGYDGVYQVSNTGIVKRVKDSKTHRAGKILKQKNTTRGYLSVGLYKGGQVKDKMVHRLVLEAFVGIVPQGFQPNHKNGNKKDNRLENLEIVTPSENTLHARRQLGRCIGETHPRAILTEQDVRKIRAMYATKEYTYHQLGDMYRVNWSTVWMVVRRKTWQHID